VDEQAPGISSAHHKGVFRPLKPAARNRAACACGLSAILGEVPLNPWRRDPVSDTKRRCIG
jgi:hypothetical protein